jgi:polysaccharide deacetylase 2 family uncharacterized protein YibQ
VPKGRSRKKEGPRAFQLVKLWLIAGAVLVVILLALWELIAGGGSLRIPGALLGRRDVSAAAERIDDAVGAAFVKVGILDVESEGEEREEGRRRWLHWEKRGRIPYGLSPFEVNVEITAAVREAGGRVLKIREGEPDWRGLSAIDMRFGVGSLETHRIRLRESPRTEGAYHAGRWLRDGPPRIAIVIDDFGYADPSRAAEFLEMDEPIAVSILPGTPHSRAIAAAARAAGKEVLLHVPMEPLGYPEVDPGEGALLLDNTHWEIRTRLSAAIDEIPEAVGVNNHMGSAFTRDRGRMRTVMAVLTERHLFFLDSMTCPQSTGFSEAVRAGIPALRNNMFIDSQLDELGTVDVAGQLEELEEIARRRGGAVGIAHPHPETLRSLERLLPEMAARGIEFVTISELAR